jgi:hypothetical protein
MPSLSGTASSASGKDEDMKALMFRGSTLLPFSILSHRKRRSIYLYRQVCGIVYWVSRSVCGSKGVFIERLPDSSQPRESSLLPRHRLLVFLNAL